MVKKAVQTIVLAALVLFAGAVNTPDAQADESVAHPPALQTRSTAGQERVFRRTTAHVEAMIRDADTNPLPGIGVAIYAVDGAANGQAIVRAVSSNQGKVIFECLKLGDYRMEVESLRGYTAQLQGGSVEFSLDQEGQAVRWMVSKLSLIHI